MPLRNETMRLGSEIDATCETDRRHSWRDDATVPCQPATSTIPPRIRTRTVRSYASRTHTRPGLGSRCSAAQSDTEKQLKTPSRKHSLSVARDSSPPRLALPSMRTGTIRSAKGRRSSVTLPHRQPRGVHRSRSWRRHSQFYQVVLAEVENLQRETWCHYASMLLSILNNAKAVRLIASHQLEVVRVPQVVREDEPQPWTWHELAAGRTSTSASSGRRL